MEMVSITVKGRVAMDIGKVGVSALCVAVVGSLLIVFRLNLLSIHPLLNPQGLTEIALMTICAILGFRLIKKIPDGDLDKKAWIFFYALIVVLLVFDCFDYLMKAFALNNTQVYYIVFMILAVVAFVTMVTALILAVTSLTKYASRVRNVYVPVAYAIVFIVIMSVLLNSNMAQSGIFARYVYFSFDVLILILSVALLFVSYNTKYFYYYGLIGYTGVAITIYHVMQYITLLIAGEIFHWVIIFYIVSITLFTFAVIVRLNIAEGKTKESSDTQLAVMQE